MLGYSAVILHVSFGICGFCEGELRLSRYDCVIVRRFNVKTKQAALAINAALWGIKPHRYTPELIRNDEETCNKTGVNLKSKKCY